MELSTSDPEDDLEDSAAFADWCDELDCPVAMPGVRLPLCPDVDGVVDGDSPRSHQSLEVFELEPDRAWATSRAAAWLGRGLELVHEASNGHPE
eukprot:14662192-Alexandrium_andersonii.AAC.1